MNRSIFFSLLALTLWSCGDSVKFEEPQPPNKSDLNQIPKKLRGTYISTSDSTYFLTINEQVVVECVDVEVRTLVDSLDIEIDSTMITKQTSNSVQVVYGNCDLRLDFYSKDSVKVNYSCRDTLFEISDQHILRRFKGHYFLNYEKGENNWKVRRLTLDKSELSFSKVRLPKDIEELKEITDVEEIKSDSGKVVGYKLNPTRRELKQLMRQNFSETKTYRKLD